MKKSPTCGGACSIIRWVNTPMFSVAYASYRGGRKITFVGYPHDIEVCKWLYHSIKNQLESEWKELKKKYKKDDTPSWMRDTKKSFFASAVAKVGVRLRELSNAAQTDYSPTETSIVLARENEVRRFVIDLGWRTGASYRFSGSGAGTAAGDRVRIQSGITGSRRLKG